MLAVMKQCLKFLKEAITTIKNTETNQTLFKTLSKLGFSFNFLEKLSSS